MERLGKLAYSKKITKEKGIKQNKIDITLWSFLLCFWFFFYWEESFLFGRVSQVAPLYATSKTEIIASQ